MLCDSCWVDSAAKSLKVVKRTWWSSCSIVLATYTSMLFALVYIDGILQPARRLLVQFSCLSFYKYISLVIVKVTHDSISLLKVLVLRTFTIHCMGLVGCLFHLLCSTLLPLVSLFLVSLLLPRSFPMSFSFVFLFSVSNFFPIVPNIPNQTSYHPIYTVSLLYTSLIILLYETFYNLLFLPILTPFHTLLQTFLPGPLHFLSSPLVPKCLLLLYIPSIALGTYPFL